MYRTIGSIFITALLPFFHCMLIVPVHYGILSDSLLKLCCIFLDATAVNDPVEWIIYRRCHHSLLPLSPQNRSSGFSLLFFSFLGLPFSTCNISFLGDEFIPF